MHSHQHNSVELTPSTRAVMKFLLLLCLLPCFASAANILVLENTVSPSHHIWMKTLLIALAEMGHNITSLSPDAEDSKIPNLHYIYQEKVYDAVFNAYSEEEIEDFFSMGELNSISMYFLFISYSIKTIKGSVHSNGFKQLLNYPDDFKFDLVIYDFIISPLFLNFVEKFGNPPIIGATAYYSSSLTLSLVGGVIAPSFIPMTFHSIDFNSYWDRVFNYVMYYVNDIVKKYYFGWELRKISQKYFPNGSDVLNLEKRTKLVLINKHSASDINEPMMPNVIPVGGLQIQRNKGLPEDLQKIMDSAKGGAILFSLGTNVKSTMLGKVRQTEILEAFRSLPQYTFLWKFEADEFPVKVPDNVIVRKWLPQSDLLEHPNLKLFISHSGLLSTQEAAWFGVPILGLPVYADQFDNLKMSIAAGVAEKGDVRNIERNSFKALIVKMMKNPKYKEKALERSKVFQDQKENPLERAVWWTEFVLRHPNMTFMRSPSVDLTLAQKQSLDVLALLFFIYSLCILLLIKLSFRFLRKIFRWKSKKNKME